MTSESWGGVGSHFRQPTPADDPPPLSSSKTDHLHHCRVVVSNDLARQESEKIRDREEREKEQRSRGGGAAHGGDGEDRRRHRRRRWRRPATPILSFDLQISKLVS
ncbi:hypothetical protein Hanom_Chr12g01129701 [Helianthus anomalus]